MMADFIVSIMGLFFRGPGLINDSYAEGPFLSGLCDIVPILTWSALYGASLAGIYAIFEFSSLVHYRVIDHDRDSTKYLYS